MFWKQVVIHEAWTFVMLFKRPVNHLSPWRYLVEDFKGISRSSCLQEIWWSRVCKKGYGQNGTKTQLRTRPQGISKITEQRKSKYIWFVIKTKDARSKGPTSRTKPWFISYLCIGGILGVLCNGLACKNSNVCDHFPRCSLGIRWLYSYVHNINVFPVFIWI